MTTANLNAYTASRLEALTSDYCGAFLERMPSEDSKALMAEANDALHRWLRKLTPRSDGAANVWCANALRMCLEDLVEGVSLYYKYGRHANLEYKEIQEIESRLMPRRAALRAYRGMSDFDRNAGMLFEFMDRTLMECNTLLESRNVQRVKKSIEEALSIVGRAGAFEEQVILESERITFDIWRVLQGPMSEECFGVVRDALQTRLERRNILPTPLDPRGLGVFLLAFGDLFRGPREKICLDILRTTSDEEATRKLKVSFGVIAAAKNEREWLLKASRARLVLRRADEFTKDQEPFADDWYGLIRDAGMTCAEVGELIEHSHRADCFDLAPSAGIKPADTANETVQSVLHVTQEYEKAIKAFSR